MAIKFIKSLEDANLCILGDKPFILMVSTTTCGPCRMFTPVFESISNSFSEYVFAKVNLDEVPEINGLVVVGSVPTFIFWKDNKELRREIGAMPEEKFKKIVKSTFA